MSEKLAFLESLCNSKNWNCCENMNEKIINFIMTHKLQYPAKEWISEKNIRIPEQYKYELDLACENIDKSYLKILRFCNSLKNNLESSIIIKGITPYLHTGSAKTKKESFDIDVFSNNPNNLVESLKNDGYQIKAGAIDNHEFQVLLRDDIVVEIHRYFPVFRVETSAIGRVLLFEKISFEDLEENIVQTYYQQYKIKIPSVEMTALIIAAHVFKKFVWQPFAEPVVTFHEIIQFYELIILKKFNHSHFLQLINKFHAQDAVGYVFMIVREYFKNIPKNYASFLFEPYRKLSVDLFGPWCKSTKTNFFKSLPIQQTRDIFSELNFVHIQNQQTLTSKTLSSSIYRISENNQTIDFKIRLTKRFFGIDLFVFLYRQFQYGDDIYFIIASDYNVKNHRTFGAHLWINETENQLFIRNNVTCTYSIDKTLCNMSFTTEDDFIFPLKGIITIGQNINGYKTISVMPFEIND